MTTAPTEVLPISQTTTTPITPETAPAVPPIIRYPDANFGVHIEALAAYLGINPADVALGMAGVMTSIAGPYAGFVDPIGSSSRLHLNLLSVDSDSPRLAALEKVLFHPLCTRTDYLRQRASSQSRQLADRWKFGQHTFDPADRTLEPIFSEFRERDRQNAIGQTQLSKVTSLPREYFDERDMYMPGGFEDEDEGLRTSPGSSHLPSVFFQNSSLNALDQMMKESLHREAFLLYPRGGVFDRRRGVSDKDEKLAAKVVAHLQGTDIQFPPLHSDQGHGTFERVRVHLWAGMSRQCVGEILDDPSSNWNGILEQCLLWETSPWPGPATQTEAPANALKAYEGALHELLDARCFRSIREQRRGMVHHNSEALFNKRQNEYLDKLAKIQAADKAYTVQFHDLPARLLWMFQQLYAKGESPPSMMTAFKTAVYAVRMHQRLLKQARESYAEKSAQDVMSLIIGIVVRKGPCKLREIQRSCNDQRIEKLKPAIHFLEQKGLLKMDEQKRYGLVPGQS